MNDSSSDIPDEDPKYFPGDDSKKIPEDTSPETLSDGIFTIKISEDMALRNALRSGLVEAQGSDTDKIPMYVSWPHWLEDGIVCLFSRDLHYLLNKTVQDAVISFEKTFEIGVESSASDTIIEEQDEEIEALPQLENDMEKVESEIETSREAEPETIIEVPETETSIEAEQETIIEVPETETSKESVQEAVKEKPEDESPAETEQQVDQEVEPDKKQETSAEISEIESEGTEE